MSSQRLFVAWVVYIWVTKRHLEGMLSSLEKWLIVLCPSYRNYRHGHDPWASSPPSALVWITHQVPSMAQLRDYYILSWTSSSGVNSGGWGVGCAWLSLTPISINAPMQSLGCSYPWPIYRLCVPILHLPLSFSHTHAHTQYVVSSSRQKDGIMSHVSASSCAESAMWGVAAAKRWVGGGVGGGGGDVWVEHGYKLACGHLSAVRFFHLSALVTLHERENVCLLSVRVAGTLPACLSPLPPLPPPHPPACVLTEQKSSSSTAHLFPSFFLFR